MILSDRDIEQRLKNDLVIDEIDTETQLQPASVDLRLDNEFVRHGKKAKYMKVTIQPGEFMLGSTLERVEIPPDLLGKVDGRSSLGRRGVSVHVTAGVIDPGYKGNITLELVNHGNEPVTLEYKERVAQIMFHELKTEAAVPYGEERGSHYQNQNGVTRSHLE